MAILLEAEQKQPAKKSAETAGWWLPKAGERRNCFMGTGFFGVMEIFWN